MKTASLFFILCLALIPFSGCGRNDGGRPVTAERPPVAVEAESVSASTIEEGIDVVGSLTPKFETEIKSQVAGLVREVFVTEWVRVKKGTPLARIDTSETEALIRRAEAVIESARADALQAQAAAGRAERERERAGKLREFGLATEQTRQDAETEVEAARARLEAARARIRTAEEELQQLRVRLDKAVLRSSLDGVVSFRDVNVGDLAADTGSAKPLFRIVDNRILNLTVHVPSSSMAALAVGHPLLFTVDAYPGRVFTGRVQYINPTVSETDRSVKVIAEVQNSSGELKGGLFAKGRIQAGVRRNVIQVPRPALVGFDSLAHEAGVFVIEDGTARMRRVATGRVAGDRVEIVSGLKEGERIVLRGGFNLKEGDRVRLTGGKG